MSYIMAHVVLCDFFTPQFLRSMWCCLQLKFIPFHCCILFRGVSIPEVICPLAVDGPLGCFPRFCHYSVAQCEHSPASLFHSNSLHLAHSFRSSDKPSPTCRPRWPPLQLPDYTLVLCDYVMSVGLARVDSKPHQVCDAPGLPDSSSGLALCTHPGSRAGPGGWSLSPQVAATPSPRASVGGRGSGRR